MNIHPAFLASGISALGLSLLVNLGTVSYLCVVVPELQEDAEHYRKLHSGALSALNDHLRESMLGDAAGAEGMDGTNSDLQE